MTLRWNQSMNLRTKEVTTHSFFGMLRLSLRLLTGRRSK